jgi:hypothetical protein
MLETELVSVAMDEISRVVSHRKPFTERGLPTWVDSAVLTSVPWVEHRMREPAGTCLQVGIKELAQEEAALGLLTMPEHCDLALSWRKHMMRRSRDIAFTLRNTRITPSKGGRCRVFSCGTEVLSD